VNSARCNTLKRDKSHIPDQNIANKAKILVDETHFDGSLSNIAKACGKVSRAF
jgi:hypothetical protein